ncbi:Polysaccharide pyruvyl transferase [Mariniflexile rhizosphaerae]|uniref:polysaccharide pyruvyl transferase family protein n=1 Tax=unclassified Mariniflexile TaxID=2643887 RepID=UPI000CAC6482|nr:polysaccharide pyruvyl transferase family protein [Mariniflexile sp. TRM1-10]AXP82467.1 Polysaccharide pyruvyl transferase [Mariniflexile sp. TRM1-10]PLB18409.1 MAG: PS_pyruv_trans domain containing protein [Flavobacteriaceae bacterium FS1-H7996/R]
MKYGLLNYIENQKYFNVGDNIQSLAAKQFLPKVDKYVDRESLADYDEEPVKLIMNGWFIHNTQNWVPSEKIKPLFVSFHMNNTAAPAMLSEKGIAYLKKYAPIGCRDQFTADTLNSKGIEAYFTGCLTLTLDSYKVDDSERGDDIYIVDPLYSYPSNQRLFYSLRSTIKSVLNGKAFKLNKKNKHLKNFISEDLLKSAIYIDQEPLNTISDAEKFEMAESVLKKYAKAKLVITSRIHCALPCLAMGTPVIFINGFDKFVDSCRFDGILELFNRLDVNSETGEYTANFNLEGKINKNTMVKNLGLHHKLAEPLKEKCRKFVAE